MNMTEYLNQGDTWMLSEGTAVSIAGMDGVQRASAATWLLMHAAECMTLVQTHLDSLALLENPHTFQLGNVITLLSQDPKNWMRTTSLYQALITDLSDDIAGIYRLVA